jgi:hypothetical protein
MPLQVYKREVPHLYESFALSQEERHQIAEEQTPRGCGQGGAQFVPMNRPKRNSISASPLMTTRQNVVPSCTIGSFICCS